MCKFGYTYDEYEPEQQIKMNDYYSHLFEKKPFEFSADKKMKTKMRKCNEKMLDKCINKHGDKYDYCSWNLNSDSKMIHVGCPIHDVFKIDKYSHVKGQGCPSCSTEKMRKDSYNSFLEKATKKFGDRFKYDESSFVNTTTPIIAYCSEHGYFELRPNSHVYNNVHCSACKNRKPQTKKSKDIL